MIVKCGDANPKGNIALYYKGGCRGKLELKDAYRCASCGGWFHLDCLLNHFEEEKGHDNARYYLKKILETSKENTIKNFAKKGLEKQNKKENKKWQENQQRILLQK